MNFRDVLKICVGILLLSVASRAVADSPQTPTVISVDASKVLRHADRTKLIGTNMALWDYPTRYYTKETLSLLKEWHPGMIRIPGGSWSDEYFWNGNGVMVWKKNYLEGGFEFLKEIDEAKLKNGKWGIDYSAYAPGFRVNKDLTANAFHGNFDIKRMHDYIDKIIGTHALVTVNVGTGTPEMAAEWVRWANKKEKYYVKYWELGNELEGRWETGHFLPDGTEMTGKIYAERFAKFAKAMKKVDPTVKIGGAAGGEAHGGFYTDMLKYAGKYVDFVSFHHYPEKQSLCTDSELFGYIDDLDDIVKHYRSEIRRYQPQRADKIELGITEWNSKLAEDRQTGDMTSGLWNCLFVGEMMKTGVSFANQWDLFTQKEKGGHCALHFTGSRVVPKSQYWAFWLWRNCMGDDLLHSSVKGNALVRVIATQDKGEPAIMIVNLSRENKACVKLDIQGFTPGGTARTWLFSHSSYLWNYLESRPQWSRPPVESIVKYNKDTVFELPAFSARVVKLLPKGKLCTEKIEPREIYPDISFIIPKTIPVNRKIEAWAMYREMGTGNPIPNSGTLELKVTKGKAKVYPSKMTLSDAAAKFFVEAQEPGHITICGWMEGVPIDYPPDDPPIYIKVLPLMETNKIFWTFENKHEPGKIHSAWNGAYMQGVKRQATVYGVKLHKALPARNKDMLISLASLPDDFPKEDIVGVTGDIFISENFKAGKDDGIRIVLQSRDAYWISLRKIKFADISRNSDAPTKVREKIPVKFLPAMKNVFVIKYLLDAHEPVTGSVYFDNLGVLLQ